MTKDEALRALLRAFRQHEDARRHSGPGPDLAAASRERYIAGMRAFHAMPR